MKNRKQVLAFGLLVLAAATVFGRSFNLNESESVDLSGIETLEFDLRGVNCALCIRTANIVSEVSGDGSGSRMELSLNGRISSNRDRAVPSLFVERSGRSLLIRLYPDNASFFGLSQSGTAEFKAVVPDSFNGDLVIRGSSDDMYVRDLEVSELRVRSSSGDLAVEDVAGALVELTVSSGGFRGTNVISTGLLDIESSSGDVDLGILRGSEVRVEASSGDIGVEDASAERALVIKASSGRIKADRVSGDSLELDTSSGKIDVGMIEGRNASIDVSSGDVDLGLVRVDDITFKLSSGDLDIDELIVDEASVKTSGDTSINKATGAFSLDGSSGKVEIDMRELSDDLKIDVSSGDVTLGLPGESEFNVQLTATSGRIRSDFPIVGDVLGDDDDVNGQVNGGGPMVDIETSSGDITLKSN